MKNFLLETKRIVLLALFGVLSFLLWTGFIATTALSLCGFFSDVSLIFELFSHMRVLYLIVFICFALVFLLLRWSKAATAATVLAVANLLPIAYLYLPHSNTTDTTNGNKLRVLQFNLRGNLNRNFSETLATIAKTDPDVVGLSEINPVWARVLEKKLNAYPYRVVEPLQGGVSIFSKYPLSNAEVRYFGKIRRPRIRTEIQFKDQKIDLVFIHPVKPHGQKDLRNRELAEVAQDAKTFKNPGIVFGDMNTTPWSKTFDKLLDDAGLRDSERGFGFQGTWNAELKFAPLPIDHLLATPHFVVRKRQVLDSVGSDHYPVLVDLELGKS